MLFLSLLLFIFVIVIVFNNDHCCCLAFSILSSSSSSKSSLSIIIPSKSSSISTTKILCSTISSSVLPAVDNNNDRSKIINTESFQEWMNTNHVVIHPSVELKDYGNNNYGLSLLKTTKSFKEGETVLKVPNHLKWKAQDIYEELKLDKTISDIDSVLQILDNSTYVKDHKAEYIFFTKLIKEVSKKEKSKWYIWIQSLPSSFTTGITFTEEEKQCLPTYSRAMVELEQIKFNTFCTLFIQQQQQQIENNLFKYEEDKEEQEQKLLMMKWAYNVVTTRMWNTEEDNWKMAEMVPIGDMFNHNYPSNVIVMHTNDSVEFVYKKNINDSNNNDNKTNNNDNHQEEEQLCISYGGVTNPHRFLIIFGFVDNNMDEIWSQLVFNNNIQSFTDKTKMVFRTSDGAISTTVWDSILYALLENHNNNNKEQQTIFYQACIDDNKEIKSVMHTIYKQQTSTILYNHVSGMVQELQDLSIKIKQCPSTSPNRNLIQQHNQFLITIYTKVCNQLLEYI